MNTRIINLIYGAVFVAVGVLGFVPNPLVSAVGLFETNAVHNLVHGLLGVVFIVGALIFPGYESRLLKLLGLGGIAVTVLGFMTDGNTLLGIIRVNQADHWLHLGLALVVLASGFLFADKKTELPIHAYEMR